MRNTCFDRSREQGLLDSLGRPVIKKHERRKKERNDSVSVERNMYIFIITRKRILKRVMYALMVGSIHLTFQNTSYGFIRRVMEEVDEHFSCTHMTARNKCINILLYHNIHVQEQQEKISQKLKQTYFIVFDF